MPFHRKSIIKRSKSSRKVKWCHCHDYYWRYWYIAFLLRCGVGARKGIHGITVVLFYIHSCLEYTISRIHIQNSPSLSLCFCILKVAFIHLFARFHHIRGSYQVLIDPMCWGFLLTLLVLKNPLWYKKEQESILEII